ncbi:DMT family transporter [Paraburkholderia fungorum]|uniref:DMT family transporter n=1 Tax=Paraburkholderia fungorum TaxID=134537 RepID=UPI00209738CD|nr:DMT family transporter [Paraburkholderia fungorum]USX06854.1 DMT family transporter [Paraburkholderia fungorum]
MITSERLAGPRSLALFAPAAFVLIWSTGFLVARYGMPYAPPFKFLTLRYALSAACFLIWALSFNVRFPTERMQFVHLSVVGIMMQAVYLGGVWAAIKGGMGAGLTSLIVGLQPVFTAAWMSSRGNRMTSVQWFGIGLGFAGLLLVVSQKLHVGEVRLSTVIFAVTALTSMTIGTLYQKRFIKQCDVRTASIIQMAAAFVVTLPLCLLETEGFSWYLRGHPNYELLGSMAWSVFGMTLGGSSLLYMLIHRGVATSVTSLFYLVPPTTAVFAWLLFSEPISPTTVIGLVITAAGVSLVTRPRFSQMKRKSNATIMRNSDTDV